MDKSCATYASTIVAYVNHSTKHKRNLKVLNDVYTPTKILDQFGKTKRGRGKRVVPFAVLLKDPCLCVTGYSIE